MSCYIESFFAIYHEEEDHDLLFVIHLSFSLPTNSSSHYQI